MRKWDCARFEEQMSNMGGRTRWGNLEPTWLVNLA